MSEDRQRRKRLGFTLVDLVVVTAFCGLLAVIMLPPAQHVRKRAQRMTCATNLRQQYRAASEYAGDNAGFYPRGIQGLYTANGDEYAIYVSAILPYLGYDGDERLWASSGSPGYPGNTWKIARKRLNKICLGFDALHCPGFPIDYYDDPNDRRYYYYPDPVEEELYGPSGENPLHYAVSAFPMPYPQYSIDVYGNPCWDEEGSMEGASSGDPNGYAESSTLESFPEDCQPASKIYVTEVDKAVPWIKARTGPGSGDFVGMRFYTVFLASQLNHSSHPRLGEDWRHPSGMNSLFFDGHVRALAPETIDPGCETPLNERIRLFSIPWEGWSGWDGP